MEQIETDSNKNLERIQKSFDDKIVAGRCENRLSGKVAEISRILMNYGDEISKLNIITDIYNAY